MGEANGTMEEVPQVSLPTEAAPHLQLVANENAPHPDRDKILAVMQSPGLNLDKITASHLHTLLHPDQALTPAFEDEFHRCVGQLKK